MKVATKRPQHESATPYAIACRLPSPLRSNARLCASAPWRNKLWGTASRTTGIVSTTQRKKGNKKVERAAAPRTDGGSEDGDAVEEASGVGDEPRCREQPPQHRSRGRPRLPQSEAQREKNEADQHEHDGLQRHRGAPAERKQYEDIAACQQNAQRQRAVKENVQCDG